MRLENIEDLIFDLLQEEWPSQAHGETTGSTTRRLLMLEMIRLVRQLWWTLEFRDKPDYSFIL